jgi:hypothetical protein
MARAQTKPSIHEIAAMPFPASVNAMREHYNPNWGKDVPEDGQKRTYRVTVEWEARGSETYEVEAFSEDEAEDLAEAEFNADGSVPFDAEFDGCHVEEVKSSEQVPA